jgi:predicted Zn-dependent protease
MVAAAVWLSLVLSALLLAGCESFGIEDIVGLATPENVEAIQRSFEDITPEQEYYIGRAVAATVLDQYEPFPQPVSNEYLNRLGQTLALVSDRPETYGGYHFLILDSEEINAFAAPGGLILVSRGLLACAETEDEVAAILAHEIAHVAERHGLQAIKKSRITTAMTGLALTAAEQQARGTLAELTTAFSDSISDITSTLINSGYSRAFEKEADLGALRTLERAGYDPWALVRMLQVMKRRLKPEGKDFAKTHPDPEDRIAYLTKELEGRSPAPAAPAPRQQRYRAALAGI